MTSVVCPAGVQQQQLHQHVRFKVFVHTVYNDETNLLHCCRGTMGVVEGFKAMPAGPGPAYICCQQPSPTGEPVRASMPTLLTLNRF